MADGERRPGELSRVVLASFIGTTIEWYDFFLYGTAAALVFNRLFFPTLDPLAGTLSAYGTFAVGFVARPVGGLVFGHFGDRIGRKTTLILTLTMMGLATFAMGLMPSYASIGVWAPILMVALRFVQGLAVARDGTFSLNARWFSATAHRIAGQGFLAPFGDSGRQCGKFFSLISWAR